MNTDQHKVGSGVWLGWFCASVMGYGAGILIGVMAAYGLFDRPVFDASMAITVGLVAGGMVGLLQWIVLRERMAGTGLWVPATAVAFALAFAAPYGLAGAGVSGEDPVSGGFLLAGVFGIGGGILQGLILRQGGVARAGLWIPANLLAILTYPIGIRLAYAIGEGGNYILAAMVLGLLIGAGIGAVNGALLVWLLRQPPSRDAGGLAAAQQ